jgi:hypothetical protein
MAPMNPKKGSKTFSLSTFGEIGASDCFHLLIAKFAIVVVFSALISPSFFEYTIINIVFWSAQKQMIWIATPGVVALMAHKHTVWYFSEKKLKDKPVRHEHRSIFLYLSISRSINRSSPIPTARCLSDIFPKPFPKSIVYLLHLHSSRFFTYLFSRHLFNMPDITMPSQYTLITI